MQLCLFLNATIDNTITEALLQEPAAGGYARITLTDGSWSDIGGGVWEYPQQTFTPSGGDFGQVYGYAVVTTGTTPRIIAIENHPDGPHNVTDGVNYRVTPRITPD